MNELISFLNDLFWIVVIALVGWSILYMIGRAISGGGFGESETPAEKFDSWFQTEQMRHNAELIDIDYQMLAARGNWEEVNRLGKTHDAKKREYDRR